MSYFNGQPEQRIGDEERDNAVDALRAHMAAGRISLDEFDQRLGQVLQSTTQRQIDAALVDLPDDPDAIGGISVWQGSNRPPMTTRPLRIIQRWIIILTPLLLLPIFLGWSLWWLPIIIWLVLFVAVNRGERVLEQRIQSRELTP